MVLKVLLSLYFKFIVYKCVIDVKSTYNSGEFSGIPYIDTSVRGSLVTMWLCRIATLFAAVATNNTGLGS